MLFSGDPGIRTANKKPATSAGFLLGDVSNAADAIDCAG